TGSLALNGAEFFRERFGDLLPGTRKVPFNDLGALEAALSKKMAAAFVVEPVQGKSCEVVADGYLAELQRLCNKYGTLLVVDDGGVCDQAAAGDFEGLPVRRGRARQGPDVRDRLRAAGVRIEAQDGVGHAAQAELRRVRPDDRDPPAAEASNSDAGGGISHGG